jgi:signal transduction histidine kinase
VQSFQTFLIAKMMRQRKADQRKIGPGQIQNQRTNKGEISCLPVKGQRSSGDALLAVINDILDLSRIERDEAELELRPLDIRECVRSSMDLMAADA